MVKTIKQNVTIELEIDYDKNNYIVYNLNTLSILMGTTSCSGNLHLYNIIKSKNGGRTCWVIPKSVVKDRLIKIEQDIIDWTHRLTTIKKVVKRCG